MRRLAYILIDKDENIFMDNVVFKSLRKAEKQIGYSIKYKGFVSTEWKPKKVVIDGFSKNKKFNHDWDFLRVFFIGVVSSASVVSLLVYMQPLVKNLVMTEENNTIIFTLLVLSSLGLSLFLMSVFKFLKKTIIYMLAIYSWINYRREDTSDLEVYYFNDYSKLEKSKLLKGDDVKESEVILEEINEK
ncbi:hypothetical protein ACI1UH_04580 [Lactococcus formosensis subsp. bovis]|uniref:hypothetical protein n=1 Tax=Lactococcus formosensis TaxID=1281486 RepID=UPI003852E9D2